MPKTINTSMDAVEHMIRGVIKSESITPSDFFRSVANAFVHGEIFSDLDLEDNDLKRMMNKIDEIIEITEKYD